MRREKIGEAVLIHADCREVLAELPRRDVLLTDPPYGIGGILDRPTAYQRKNGVTPESWDDARFPHLDEVRAKGTAQIIWGGNYYAHILPPSRGWLAWHKPDAPPSMADFELAWTNMDRNAQFLSHAIVSTNPERVGHPTQKPVRLMEWCLSLVPSAETCIDLFMGSGSTGVACARLGLSFIGVEQHATYFDMACQRIYAAYSQRQLFQPQQAHEREQIALI